MTSEQIKKKIEQVLGNDIRCLLPSYWWKSLFHSVVDRIDEVDKKIDESSSGITTVNSKSELDNLNLRKGSIATVMNEGSKFSDCYQLADGANVLESLMLCTRVRSIGVRENHGLLDGEEGMAILLSTDSNYGAAVGVNYSDGLFQKTAMVINPSTGDLQQMYYLPSDAFNKFLAENDMRFISTNGGLSSLDKAFVINADADVYVKGDFWERLQDEGDAGDIQDAVFVVGFNEKGEPLCTDEQKEANILSFNKYTNNMNIRCVLKYYYQFDDGTVVYPAQVHPEAVGHSYLMGGFSLSVIFKGVNLGDAPFMTIPLIGKYDINFSQTGDVLVLPNLNMGQVNLLYITLDPFGNLDLTDWNKRHNKAIYDSWTSSYDTPVPAMAWVNRQPSLALYPAIISGAIENNTLKTLYAQVNISNYKSKVYTINSDGSLEELYEDRIFDSEMSDTSTKGVQNKVIKKYVDELVAAVTHTKTVYVANFGTPGCKTFDEMNSVITALNLPKDDPEVILRCYGVLGDTVLLGQSIIASVISDDYIELYFENFTICAYKETQAIKYLANAPLPYICIYGNGNPLPSGTQQGNARILNAPEDQFANFDIVYMIGDTSGQSLKLTPISVQRFPSVAEADWATHYDIVVYVNDVFEKWRINIDGSVVKLS